MKDIRIALIFAVLMVGTALLGKSGVIDNRDLALRLTMALNGFFLVSMGNALPKTLKPLKAGQCDPACTQSFQRFSGWTWVMTGLTFAMVWLVLPVETAKTVGIMVMDAGTLTAALRLMQLLRTRRREA